MIESRGFDAVVCCDCCLKELSYGPYPADAADNLGDENWVISGDGERPDEHYCPQCYADMEQLGQLPDSIEQVKHS
jgi:hypothetical protein